MTRRRLRSLITAMALAAVPFHSAAQDRPPSAPAAPGPGAPPTSAPTPATPPGQRGPAPASPDGALPRPLDIGPAPEPFSPRFGLGDFAPRALIGPNLFNFPAAQGPITLTPSLTVTEEFNDNVFLNARRRRSDFITGFTPGVTLSIRRPDYQLSAGYNFTAELYARETELSNAANRQNFVASAAYQINPRWSLSLVDSFAYDRNTNAVSNQNLASGRQESWSNTLSPAVSWQATPLTSLRLFGSHNVQQFTGELEGESEDTIGSQDTMTYRIGVAADHAFTPRLTGTASYEFAYIVPENNPNEMTHTPRLGLSYQFTPTLSGSLSGGPSLVVRRGETRVEPAFTASLDQRFRFGSVSVSYDRSVGAAGGLGAATDNQSIGGSVNFTTLARGLVFGLGPRYARVETPRDRGVTRTDVDTLSLGLFASYQIARMVTLIGSYNFFYQRSDNSTVTEIDQNRVFLGLQIGYPFNFD